MEPNFCLVEGNISGNLDSIGGSVIIECVFASMGEAKKDTFSRGIVEFVRATRTWGNEVT